MPVCKDYVTVSDGTKIEILLVTPERAPKAVVLLPGGGGLKKEFYAKFAEGLAEGGFAVVLLDYRGIGGSTYRFLTTQNATIQDWAKLDITGVLQWMTGEFSGLPRFFIGHSFGGIMSGFVEELPSLSGLILLCASSGDLWRMRFPYRILPAVAFYVYVPLMARFSPRIPMRVFGGLDDLPRGVGLTWGELAKDRTYLQKRIDSGSTNFDKYRGPLLSLIAADDPIAPEGIGRELHEMFTAAKSEFRVIEPNGKKIGHFGFFSRRFKDTLWADLIRWMDDRIPATVRNQPSP